MISRAIVACLAFLSAFASVSCAAQPETATLRVRFKLKGDVPKLPEIVPTRDKASFGQRKIPDERLVVDPQTRGIANVILYADTSRRGTLLPHVAVEAKTVVLAQKHCRYEPRIVFLAVGDTLQVNNQDGVGHNANIQFLANAPSSISAPPGAPYQVKLAKPEPAPIPIRCNIHPWMTGYAVILEHRYAGASDPSGLVEIKGLPPGEATFRAVHESSRLEAVICDDEPTVWSGGRFKVTLQPGLNDLGVVEVPVEAVMEALEKRLRATKRSGQAHGE